MPWSPDAPTVVGLDWPVTRQVGLRVWDPSTVAEATIMSTATETVVAVVVRLESVAESQFTLSVFDDGTLVDSSAVTVVADGDVSFPLSWSKADATAYRLQLSRTSGDGEAVWPALAGEPMPLGHTSTLDGAAHAFMLERSDGAPSVDSQPYHTLTREPVYDGRTVAQEITEDSAVQRGWVQLQVARARTTTHPLEVRIRRVSDDVQVGGTATIQPHEVSESYRLLTAVPAVFAPSASLSAAQHYVEVSSDAAEVAPWEVAVLTRLPAPGVPNLLDDNTSWLESTVGTWTLEDGSDSIARTASSDALVGTHVLDLNGSNPVRAFTSGLDFGVSDDKTYRVSARTRLAPVDGGLIVGLWVRWRVDGSLGSWIEIDDGTSVSTEWRTLEANVVPPAGATHIQVRLQQGGDRNYWDDIRVEDLDAGAVKLGFGGTTDVAIIDGARDTQADLPLIYATVPAVPDNVSAAAHEDGVEILWDAVTGADGYRVLRDGQLIGTTTVASFIDYEAPAFAADYQVQTVEGRVWSAASTVSSATAAGPAVGSNQGRWRHQISWLRGGSFEFPQHREVWRIDDRDGHRAQKSSENFGDIIDLTLHVSDGQVRTLFDTVEDVSRSEVDYVALTSRDRLWFGDLNVSSGTVAVTGVGFAAASFMVTQMRPRPDVR